MTIIVRVLLGFAASAMVLACTAAPRAGAQDEGKSRSAIVLAWSRAGGLAGFCDELEVTAAGDAIAKSCQTAGTRTRKLSADELRHFEQLRQEFGSVSVTSSDAATADAMKQTLTLHGNGTRQPSEQQRQELLDWALRVYSNSNMSK